MSQPPDVEAPDIEALWRDPRHWRGPLGLCYVCPADPRVIVPKRTARLGWTVNLAHPGRAALTLGWLSALVLLPFGCSLLLARRMLHGRPATGELLLRALSFPVLVMALSIAALCVACAQLARPPRP